MRALAWLLFGCVGCTAGTLGGANVGGESCEAKLVGSTRQAIVNGSPTSAYPAVGFLTYGGGAFCTGTVIAPRTVVTAAHCVEDSPGGGFYFAFGASDRSPSRSIRVRSAQVHPMWDSYRLLNDIALLELEEDAGVTPVPVLFERPATSWTVKLVGYGVSNGYAQSGGGTKREVDVTIYSLEDTTWSYRTMGGRSACNGDSGGPALYSMGGELVLMGITSWGDQYCVENGYYTRTDLYRSFLSMASEPGGGGGGTTPPPEMDPPPPSTELCTNTCRYANDGECDDGGPGSLYDVCAFGTDCGDCGPRADPSAPAPPEDDPDKDPPPPLPEEPPPSEDPPPPSEDPMDPPPSGGACSNDCPWAFDGECDDGGRGSMCRLCALGSDCADCGAR